MRRIRLALQMAPTVGCRQMSAQRPGDRAASRTIQKAMGKRDRGGRSSSRGAGKLYGIPWMRCPQSPVQGMPVGLNLGPVGQQMEKEAASSSSPPRRPSPEWGKAKIHGVLRTLFRETSTAGEGTARIVYKV